MRKQLQSHRELEVYKRAFDSAMQLFELSQAFPREETYSLTDQVRKSSRSVCANLAEAWRKRRYPAAFTAKLNEVEGEVAETQVWIEFAVKCGYIARDRAAALYRAYEGILRMLATLIDGSDSWIIPNKQSNARRVTRPPRL